jgi:hypothetical protein
MSAPIRDPAHALQFMLAGKAHVTFVSLRTGARFTYRIELAEKRPGDTRPPPHFVSLLNGPSNTDDYVCLGTIFASKVYVHNSKKSRVAPDAPSAKAFAWTWKHLSGGLMPAECEVWHDGHCSKCRRLLTDPESVAVGVGPVCRRGLAS